MVHIVLMIYNCTCTTAEPAHTASALASIHSAAPRSDSRNAQKDDKVRFRQFLEEAAYLAVVLVEGGGALGAAHTPQLHQAIRAGGHHLRARSNASDDAQLCIVYLMYVSDLQSTRLVMHPRQYSKLTQTASAYRPTGRRSAAQVQELGISDRVEDCHLFSQAGHGRACVPAERKATRSTDAVWPSNVRRHAPSASAHSRTVASPDAVATACAEHTSLLASGLV